MNSSERAKEIVLPPSVAAKDVDRLAFRPSYSRYDAVSIDLSRLRFIRPIGVIAILCLAAELSDKRIRCRIVVPRDGKAWSYLYRIGLLEALSHIEPLDVGEGVLDRVDQRLTALIPVRGFSSYTEVEEIAARVEDVFQASSAGLASLLLTCHTVVAELAGNVVAHSGTGRGWILAQRYIGGDSPVVEIAVGDGGIGIRRSLAKNKERYRGALGDRDSLRRAVDDGVSRFADPHRGFGLGHIRAEVRKGRQRKLFLASGVGRLHIYSDGKVRTGPGPHIPGVLAEARVPC